MIHKLRNKLHDMVSPYTFGEKKDYFFIEPTLDFFIRLCSLWIGFKRQFKSFFYWGWKLREDMPWDHSYLEHLLYLKIKQMYDYFKDSDIACWTSEKTNEEYKAFKALRIAYKILERIENDTYGRSAKKIDELYGEIDLIRSKPDDKGFCRIEFKRAKETPENEKYLEELTKECRKLRWKNEERDRKILFSILTKWIPYWWD